MKKFLLLALLLVIGCSQTPASNTPLPLASSMVTGEALHFDSDVWTQWGGEGPEQHYLRLEDNDSTTVIKSTGYTAPQADYYTLSDPATTKRACGIIVTFQGLYRVGEGNSWVVNFDYIAGTYLGSMRVELASIAPAENTWTTYTDTLYVSIPSSAVNNLECEVSSAMEGRSTGDMILISAVSHRLLYVEARRNHGTRNEF